MISYITHIYVGCVLFDGKLLRKMREKITHKDYVRGVFATFPHNKLSTKKNITY